MLPIRNHTAIAFLLHDAPCFCPNWCEWFICTPLTPYKILTLLLAHAQISFPPWSFPLTKIMLHIHLALPKWQNPSHTLALMTLRGGHSHRFLTPVETKTQLNPGDPLSLCTVDLRKGVAMERPQVQIVAGSLSSRSTGISHLTYSRLCFLIYKSRSTEQVWSEGNWGPPQCLEPRGH